MGNASSSEFPRIEDDPYFADSLRTRSQIALVTERPSNEYVSRNGNNRQELRQRLFGEVTDNPGQPRTGGSPQTSKESLNSSPLSRKSSIHLGKGHIDVQSAISILHELKKTASPEDLIALQQALSQESCSQPLNASAASSDPTIVRRSSRFTPGIATRNSSSKVLQKKSLSRGKGKTHTWSPDMFVPSPLSELAKLKNKDGSGSQTSRSRPTTPGESDSQPLGAYQLGSLRITNGEATPEPSICSKTRVIHKPSIFSQPNDSYLTAPECADSNSIEMSSDAEEGDTISPIVDEKFHADYFTCRSLIPPSSDVKSITPSESLRSSTGTSRRALSRRTTDNSSVCSSTTTPLEPSNAAQMYLCEISSNPYLSPDLGQEKVESKDIGEISRTIDLPGSLQLDDESIYSDQRSTNEVDPLKIRKDRDQTLDTLIENATEAKEDEPESTEVATSLLTTSQHDAHLSEKPSWEEGGDLQFHASQNSPQIASLPHSHPETEDQDLQESLQQKSPAYKPSNFHDSTLDDEIVSISSIVGIKSMLRTDPPWASENPQPEKQERHSISPAWPLRPQFASHSTPDVRPRRKEPEVFNSSPVLSEKKDGSESKSGPKKLHKKRRPASTMQLRGPPIVQGHKPVGSVPSVPSAMVDRHAQRLNDSPGMEHLEHTYDSVSVCETHLDSPILAPTSGLDIRFPSPDPNHELSPATKRGRREARPLYEPPSSGRIFPTSRSRKRSANRRRSTSEDRENYIGVADFGTVAQSLGSSPYDLATVEFDRAHPERARMHARQRQQVTHPHQMTQARQAYKAKSMIGMDEKAASQLALQRSRERQEFSQEFVAYTDERPPPLANATRSKTIRPKSINGPPVPAKDDQYASYASSIVRPSDDVALDIDSDPVDWTTPSRLWRQRRKSIGEGLLKRAPTPGPPSEEPTSNTTSQSPKDLDDRHRQPSLPSLKTKQTFPSIRDRALLFERKERENSPTPSASPSPTRRKRMPSPTKPLIDTAEKSPKNASTDSLALSPTTKLRMQEAELFIPLSPNSSATDLIPGGTLPEAREEKSDLTSLAAAKIEEPEHSLTNPENCTTQSARERRTRQLQHGFDTERTKKLGLDLSDVPVMVRRVQG